MLFDWMTLSIDAMNCSAKLLHLLESKQNMLLMVSPTGELIWRAPVRKDIRSDTHSITVRLCSALDIYGSPARCMGEDSNNVFGSFDLMECFRGVLKFVSTQLDCALPWDPELWQLRRLDITGNYDLGHLDTVKQALNYLRHTQGGRYQIKTNAETVYWSYKSKLRAGKAYAKGPHMAYMIKRGKAELTQEKLEMVQRLLRLELTLGSQFWRRDAGKPWFEFTNDELLAVYTKYFSQFIGDIEVSEVTDVLDKLIGIAPTPGQAKAAYKTWSLIQTHGEEATKALTNQATWYRHKALLKQVGISWADMHEGRIVPFRRRTIVLGDPVTSWEDLEHRCA